jgi:hypothetical protein
VTSPRAIEDPARRRHRWFECAWHRSSRRMEDASACVVNIDILTMRGSNRSSPAAKANRQSSGHSNQSLSKIARRTQIIGRGRVQPDRNDLSWRNLMRRSEGLGCVRGGGSSGEGFSGSAVTYAAHNTNFTLSRRCAPLATAGEVVGLWERRWTPLRRPCGRLSGRRETLNVR